MHKAGHECTLRLPGSLPAGIFTLDAGSNKNIKDIEILLKRN
jgi:hypothetical protein